MTDRVAPGPREVTLVLCTRDGTVLGSMPPYRVESPWWQEVREVVSTAQELYGLEVTILRLLHADPSDVSAGGRVTYLAEVPGPPAHRLGPWHGKTLVDEPLRQPWARPGGPAEDIRWARSALFDLGTVVVTPPEQVRTWNVSSLWRLVTTDGAAWLKVVPSFFAHEGAVLSALAPGVGPPLLATEGPRVLLAEVDGEDFYVPPAHLLLPMVRMLVELQVQWVDRVDELVALGAPDWRAGSFPAIAADAVEWNVPDLDAETLAALERLLGGIDQRFDDVAACGVPDTLVHGDFHPGNVRGTDERLVLLDWGDCGVGNPLLDEVAFAERVPPAEQPAVTREWARLWRQAVPGSEPERAGELLAPISALRQAVVYTTFVRNIEPSERVYHQADPAIWMRRAASMA